MKQQNWFGVIAQDGAPYGWEFAAGSVVRDLDPTQIASLSQPVLAFGGGAAEPVPAPVLPRSAPGGDLTQSAPQGCLPAAMRLALLGLCRTQKDWDGVACLIGPDRSHWVQISADEVVSFQSFLTPRLFSGIAGPGAAWPQEAAGSALEDTLSRPERLASQMSSAELNGNAAALLGHLIGAELAATRPYWLGQRVAVIAPAPQAAPYFAALRAQGVMTDQDDLSRLQQQGFLTLYDKADPGS